MFNVFKKILLNQPVTVEESKKVSDFVLLRWLTGDPRLIGLASSLNQVKKLPDSHILCNAMAKALNGQVKFIKYPSVKKLDTLKREHIEYISRYFEVGDAEANEYYEWMKNHCPDELKILKQMYKGTV